MQTRMSKNAVKEVIKLLEKLQTRYELPKNALHICMDLETTGLGKAKNIRITEVGAVGLLQKDSSLEWTKIGEFQRHVSVVSKNSNWGKVGKEFTRWVRDLGKNHKCKATYVHAHNGIRYDFPIICCENHRFGIKQPKDWRLVDTLKTFDEIVERPKKSNRKLGTFHYAATKKYIVNQHTALPDAQALASIYLACSLKDRNNAIRKWHRPISGVVAKYTNDDS